jgi:Do/DeqQ family serine protease
MEPNLSMRRFLIPLLSLAVLAACSGQPGKSSAQGVQGGFATPDRRVPGGAGEMRMSFAPVVKKAAPAVVNVFSRRVVRQQIDPFWQMFGMRARPGVEQSLGSGAIVRSDGIIVTNHHVVAGGQDIQVVLSDRRQFAAKILLDDARADIAVLKIDAKENLPTIAIDDKGDIQVGDLVLAIGDPFGVGQTVTNGIISALGRTQVSENDFSAYIQTDAPINPGNSGGPLVDMNGDLIGINTFIVSQSGGSAGVGFAIPAAMVRQVVTAAVGGGHAVVRPWLGARGQEVSSEIASSLGLPRPEGVLVAEVYPGSAADRAGLEPQDIILTVDGQAVDEPASLDYAFATRNVGQSMSLEVRRGKATRTVTVRTEAAPSTPARDERTIVGRNPLGGATVINLSPAAAQELGADPFAARGVMISRISEEGLANEAGVAPGDIIKAVNGQPIRTTTDLQQALGASAGAWRLTIVRNGQEISGNFRL